MDGDIGGFLILRGEGETTLWGGRSAQVRDGWNGETGDGTSVGFGVGESW